jgi:hypothetical protein
MHGGGVDVYPELPRKQSLILAPGPRCPLFGPDCQLIHLTDCGPGIKTVRSHPSVSDLALLAADSTVNGRSAPLPPARTA